MNKPSKVTIFIDESGTLPDPRDKIIVMAAVGINTPRKLLEVNKKVRKALRAQGKRENILEIKFYRAGERTKLSFLKELSQVSADLFVLIVDKKGQKISDTPLNFAALSSILLEECIIFYGDQIQKIIFDRHFHRDKDVAEFNQFLFFLLKDKFLVDHVDSRDKPEVNAADMVAGSVLWARGGKKRIFYDLISGRIISEKNLDWKEAKSKFYKKSKKLH